MHLCHCTIRNLKNSKPLDSSKHKKHDQIWTLGGIRLSSDTGFMWGDTLILVLPFNTISLFWNKPEVGNFWFRKKVRRVQVVASGENS